MKKHKIIKSKMKKTAALLEHPIVSQHVPDTAWFTPANLKKMFARYRVVYIKPDHGNQGSRVIRVQKVGENEGVLSFNHSITKIALSDLPSKLYSVTSKHKFIIQQGIDLATYNHCPFDIRMVMQKPYFYWELTLTSAKVALREEAVVTNVARGAQDYPLNYILQRYDQKQDPMATLRELVDLAHQMSAILGSRFPLSIIGFDMALDKKGKVWFIEANTWPQCARCKLVNDEVSRKKFEDATNIMFRNPVLKYSISG